MDLEQFTPLICGAALTFGRELNKVAIGGFWLGLQDLTLEQLETGLSLAIRECDRMPTASEIRRLAGVKTNEDKAVDAFAELTYAVESCGSGKSVDFADTTINAVVRHLGGWEYVCERPESIYETWIKKEFLSEYVRLCGVGVDYERAAGLIGRHDRRNMEPKPKYVRIGSGNAQPRIETESAASDLVANLVSQKAIVNSGNSVGLTRAENDELQKARQEVK